MKSPCFGACIGQMSRTKTQTSLSISTNGLATLFFKAGNDDCHTNATSKISIFLIISAAEKDCLNDDWSHPEGRFTSNVTKLG